MLGLLKMWALDHRSFLEPPTFLFIHHSKGPSPLSLYDHWSSDAMASESEHFQTVMSFSQGSHASNSSGSGPPPTHMIPLKRGSEVPPPVLVSTLQCSCSKRCIPSQLDSLIHIYGLRSQALAGYIKTYFMEAVKENVSMYCM